MSFGETQQYRGYVNDSVPLEAWLYDTENETPIPAASISSVTFTVMKPTDPPGSPSLAGAVGTVPADGKGLYVVPPSFNNAEGQYRGLASFTFTDPNTHAVLTRSVPIEYEILDPLAAAGTRPATPALDLAWTKLTDCFDSSNGGPWLKDMTLSHFGKDKLADFLPEVLLEVNATMPQSEYTEATFPYVTDDGTALLAHGLLVAAIRHLMRSYTEQPNVANAPVGYLDRTKYQQAWSVIYQIELERWKQWLQLWKARSFNLNSSSILVSQKAGRLMSRGARARGPMYRGWM